MSTLMSSNAVTAQLISAFVFATYIVQCLYFLNLKFQAFSHLVAVQPGLCRTWSEIPKTGFLVTRLILKSLIMRITAESVG